ncbi:thiamine pyrophosphokinase [Rhizina undulata]
MGNDESKVIEWWPTSFFSDEFSEDEEKGFKPFALLILNREILNLKMFKATWKNAQLRICADGGANRLFDALNPEERTEYIPNCIKGDLDSIRTDVRSFYAANGVEIIKNPDQNSTDFGKCLVYIAENDLQPIFKETSSRNWAWNSSEKISVEYPKLIVVAWGGFGGRVDQSFHSVHVLFVAAGEVGRLRQIYVVSDESITFLLQDGVNIIHTPQTAVGPTCGIIPVAGPAIISTKGFEWNLMDAETRFGGLVSTSNHLKKDIVEVKASDPIIFTAEIRKSGS